MSFKIYTKTGDKGTTGLIGGQRVSKHHVRIESYGTVDELNSFIGVISDCVNNSDVVADLREIQDRLFTIGSELATGRGKEIKMQLPDLRDEDVQWLENKIDWMNEVLPEMRSFILPGGNLAASMTHVARCVCRRAERICVGMNENAEEVPQLVLQYLNRLSDYLFVLARYIVYQNKGEEIPWRPRI